MKKYITLFTFICVLFLGIQTATAQESVELKAKKETIKLQKSLELSSAQVKKVYKIFLALETEMVNGATENEALIAAKKKISDVLETDQLRKFSRSFMKDRARQEKLKRGQ